MAKISFMNYAGLSHTAFMSVIIFVRFFLKALCIPISRASRSCLAPSFSPMPRPAS